MTLKVLLPFQVLADTSGVTRIVAETHAGAFGVLEHRLDCVAALRPGILTYETAAAGEAYIAVDEGVLVKTGSEVLVSARWALCGTDLAALQAQVERELRAATEREADVRTVVAKLEVGLLRRLSAFEHQP